MKKSILSLLLAVAFIVSCLSVAAFAETTEVEALELPEKILLSTNGDSETVYPRITPDDADESLAWQISDKSIVSVTQLDGGAYVELVGKKEGIAEGQKKKAVEAALLLVHDYNASPEEASEKMNAPLELVLEALKQKK